MKELGIGIILMILGALVMLGFLDRTGAIDCWMEKTAWVERMR